MCKFEGHTIFFKRDIQPRGNSAKVPNEVRIYEKVLNNLSQLRLKITILPILQLHYHVTIVSSSQVVVVVVVVVDLLNIKMCFVCT